MIHVGTYHEYIGGFSVRCRDTMMHVGDIMIHVWGYHEYIGRCSVHRAFQYKSKASINLVRHINPEIPPIYS